MKEEKGKNIIIGLLIAIIILLIAFITLIMTGKIKVAETNNKPANEIIEETNIKLDKNKEYVYDADYSYNNKYLELGDARDENNNPVTTYTNDGLHTTIWNNGKQYSKDLKVPYININTKEVENINKNLQKLYEEYAARFDEYANSTQGGSQILTYYTYTTNNILSVIITYGYQSTDVLYPEYIIYNFDLLNGNLLDYDAFLNKLNWTKEDASAYAHKQIDAYIVGNISFENQNRSSSIDEFKKQENNNKLLYFVDKKGNINYIVTIYVNTGRGYSSHLITIDKDNY